MYPNWINEGQIFSSSSQKSQLCDYRFQQFLAQMQIYLLHSKNHLKSFSFKIESVIQNIQFLENQIKKVNTNVKSKHSSVYSNKIPFIQEKILNFSRYAEQLKIVDQKNWPLIQKQCQTQLELKPKINKQSQGVMIDDGNIDNDKDVEEDFIISSQDDRIYLNQAINIPLIFGHRKIRNLEFIQNNF